MRAQLGLCLGVGLLLSAAGCSFLDPAHGVGVTFPEGWRVEEVSASVYEEERRAAYPEVDQWLGYEIVSIVAGWDPDFETECVAFGGSDPDAPYGPPFVIWEAADGVLDRTIERTRDRSDERYWELTGTGRAILPSGRADRIDADRFDEKRQAPDLLGTQYTVTSGDRTLVLACYGSERPDDRWLSIAEALEFSP